MSDKKISALTALTAAANDDVFAVVDTSATETKKITADVLGEYMSINTHVVNAINGAVSVLGTPIDETIVEAKGDLIVATADATPARLAVGDNNYVLTADSAVTAGVKWAAIPTPTVVWESDQNLLANAIFS